MAQSGEGQWADSGAPHACAVRVSGALWDGGMQPSHRGGSLSGGNGSHLPRPALSSLIRVIKAFEGLNG